MSADPAAGGTVTGGGAYDQGAQVTVGATANDNYNFVNWTEGGAQVSASAQYVFNATVDRTLVAHFQAVAAQYTLTAAVSPANSGTIKGNGIDCPGTCTQDYEENTDVQLTATPKSNNKFLRWEGALTGTTNPGTVTMTGDKQTTAYFGAVSGNTDTDGVSDTTESGP